MDVNATLEAIAFTGKEIEDFTAEYLTLEFSGDDPLGEIIGYCSSDIGLRLLPFLLRVSYEAGERAFKEILPTAAGIEMLKASALAIDDVLDESLSRNNKPSVYSKWGANATIAAGTAMYSLAFELSADSLDHCMNCNNKVAVLSLLAKTHKDIYEGQLIDLKFEGNVTVSEEQYLDMISKTTASFIRAPLVIGAMLWDAPQEVIEVLSNVGIDLGMAYQLRDDVIDIIGDPELTGKPKAGDVRERKMRLPLIRALAHSGIDDKEKLAGLLAQDRPLERLEVDWVIGILEQTGSIQYVIDETKKYCTHATDALGKIEARMADLCGHLQAVAALLYTFDG
jgi:geranylgeranyl pyrophosphate synthase